MQFWLARTTTECCGHPLRWKWPWFVEDSEANGQVEPRGFVGPVIASAEASTLRLRDALRPRTEMPLTDSSFPSGTGSEGRPRRFPCARARWRPATARSFNRSRSNWLSAATPSELAP